MATILTLPYRRVLRERHTDEALYAPFGFLLAEGAHLSHCTLTCDAASPYPVVEIPLGLTDWSCEDLRVARG